MDRRRLIAVVVVLALVALAGCGRPPPETEVVCDGCETDVARTVPDVTVTDSVTHIRVRETGAADVEARLQLSGAGVDELRVTETRRRQVAASMRARPSDRGEYSELTRPAFPREGLAVAMDGETLVVTYRYPNFSDRRLAGTTLSHRFYRLDGRRDDEFDYEEPIAFETDRLVVHAPAGTRPIVTPPNATDSGDRLVWTGGTVDPRSYLVFGTGGRLLGRLVVAADVFGWAAWSALFAALGPALGLFVQAGLFAGYYPRRLDGDGWDPSRDRLFWALVGIESVVIAFIGGWVLGTLLVGLVAAFGTAGAVTLGYALVSSDAGDEPAGPAEADPDGPGDQRGTDAATDRTDTDVATGHTARRPTEEPGSTGEADSRDQRGGSPARGTSVTAGTGSSRRGALLEQFGGHLAVVGVTLGAVGALTMAVAFDDTATYSGSVALAAGVVPLLSFGALGYLVTTDHDAARLTAVTGVVTAPWVLAFALVVTDGAADTLSLLLATLAWGPLVSAVGLLAFYAVLWLTTW